MALDMTGPARHQHEVHWRHYLDKQGRPMVVCVQDFDYPDYDASRFLDAKAFDSEAEARETPIDLLDIMLAATTREEAADALRNIRAVLRHAAPALRG